MGFHNSGGMPLIERLDETCIEIMNFPHPTMMVRNQNVNPSFLPYFHMYGFNPSSVIWREDGGLSKPLSVSY